MAVYGVDLGGLFTDEHPWWRYLNWIDRLPRHSQLWSGMADDPEAFGEGDIPSGPGRKHPTFAEYSVEVEHLTNIEDLLNQLIVAYGAVNSKKGKAPKYKPRPRPVVVGIERAKQKKLMEQHDFLKSRLLPNLYGG